MEQIMVELANHGDRGGWWRRFQSLVSPTLVGARRAPLGLMLAVLLAQSTPTVAWGQDDEAATVAIAPVGAAGPILVDPAGWTLYTWSGDAPGQSFCSEVCAAIWPPYTIETDPVAPGELPGTLGLAARYDGSWQVTYDGWPLYYSVGDRGPGEAGGEGSTGFGARWSIVSLGQPQPVAVAPQAPAFTVPASPPSFTPPQPPTTPPAQPAAASPNPPSLQIPGYMGGPTTGFPPRPPQGYGLTYPTGMPGYALGSEATLTVLAPPTGSVALMWPASPIAQAYRIYTTPINQPNNLQVAQTINQSLGVLVSNVTLAGLTPGTTYLIQVRAVEPGGREVVVPAVTNAGPGAVLAPIPGIPSGLNVTAISPTTVTLSWTGTAGAASYLVLQSLSASGPFVQAAITSGSTTTALVTGLTANATYYFQVRAVDLAGNSSLPSNTVSPQTI